MKIIHLTSVHKSNDVRIFHKECCTLAKEGYDVNLVSPGALDGMEGGVKIHGVRMKSKNRIDRMVRTVNAVLAKGLELNGDVYHLHDPELLRIVPVLTKHSKRVVYDVHEDVPRQLLGKYWLRKWQKYLLSSTFEKFENYMARRVDYVIAATPTIRDRFLQVNPNSIDVNNFPKLDEFFVLGDVKKELEVCYIGGVQKIRGLSEVIASLPFTKVKLNLGGSYSPPEFRDELTSLDGWSSVNELGFLDREAVVHTMKRSIAGLVTLHPLVNYLDSLPVKMFEYMSAGIPVIASDFPLWKKIIDENECGICVNPLEPQEIAKAINLLANNPENCKRMGENGRRAVESKFNWDIEANKLLKVYELFQ